MKSLLIGLALTVSTAAVAQTQPDAMAPAAAPAGETVAAGNTAPERDARGIAVVSEPATAPAGANQMFTPPPAGTQVVINPNQQVFTPQPAAGEMPPCSRTVTDRCTQTYERGRAPR